MRVAAQLIGRTDFRISGSEPGKELADGPAILTDGARTEGNREGVDGAAEGRGADDYESTGPIPPISGGGGGAGYEDDIPF